MQRKVLIWLFLAPTVIGLGVFSFLPILASVGLAFFSWDIITPPKFVGLDNFTSIAADPTIRVSFLNTIGFVVVAVTLQLMWLKTETELQFFQRRAINITVRMAGKIL